MIIVGIDKRRGGRPHVEANAHAGQDRTVQDDDSNHQLRATNDDVGLRAAETESGQGEL
jgi:hypothetical protein